MSWGALALQLTPESALILFTLGMLLVYVELNRPGMIVPGAAGLLAVLLALAAMLSQTEPGARAHIHLSGSGLALSVYGLALIAAGSALLLLDLLRRTSIGVALAAILALALGFSHLVASPAASRIPALSAILCAAVLGGATATLTRIARRARANKALKHSAR